MPAEKMRHEYTYTVREVAPQTKPSISGLTASAERSFIVPCEYAQDFGLRALGKLYEPGTYDLPELPVEYPIATYDSQSPQNIKWDTPYPQRLRLRASGFRIDPVSDACFNNQYEDRDQSPTAIAEGTVKDLGSILQLARHWKMQLSSEVGQGVESSGDPCCECVVTVQYQEPWWQCLWDDAVGTTSSAADLPWLQETAFRIDRVASYELYTRPSRSLVWDGKASPDNHLGPDSHAVVVIPSAEITVEWHNVPVSKLCSIEGHLGCFRDTVNDTAVTLFGKCACSQSVLVDANCDSAGTACQYEPETLLFVDYAEDKNQRTNIFGPMDTTTIFLTFKHKRIATKITDNPPVIVGHNHLLYDKTTDNTEDDWHRVKVKMGVGDADMFTRKEFSKIFKMEDACSS